MFKKILYIFLLSIASFPSFGSIPHAAPQDYITVFKTGTLSSQIVAAKSLEFSGLSSEEIFDVIEKNVNKYVTVPEEDDTTIFYMVWLTKALSFSGDEKYRKTIEYVEANGLKSTVKRHAFRALKDIEKYRAFNEAIAPKPWVNGVYPEKNIRTVNMVKSGFPELQLAAAMDIYESKNYKEQIILALKEKVQEKHTDSLNSEELDAIAWMCKALAGSGMTEQITFLQGIQESTKEKKLKKYIKSYIAKFA